MSSSSALRDLFVISAEAHGVGRVVFKWDVNGKYLATCGKNRRVHVFDRSGALLSEFALEGDGPCMQLAWDRDGDCLAVLQQGNGDIPLWSVSAKQFSKLQTNLKDPTFLCWSRGGPYLAIGTQKGNLLIYNKLNYKKVPVLGKHSKEITCGVWSVDNKLALASADKMLTISDPEGRTLKQEVLKAEPYDLQFADPKLEEKQTAARENTVSVNMGRKTILMYNLLEEEDAAVELAFQPKYGQIVSYRWFGDGYILVGFSKGFVVAVSTHMKEIGEELHSLHLHESQLYDVVYSPALNQIASAGDDGIRLMNMDDWKEVAGSSRQFTGEEIEKLEWTADGQILTASSSSGIIRNFLMSIPVLSAAHQSMMVYLSSLRSVALTDVAQDYKFRGEFEIAVEPSFLQLGPQHVAAGMNNHVWFYELNELTGGSNLIRSRLVNERDYNGTVKQIALNDTYAAALCDGKIYLHAIDPAPASSIVAAAGRESLKTFPAEEGVQALCMALTPHFLIFATSRGNVCHFYLKDWAMVNDSRHEVPVVRIFPNALGTRAVLLDQANRAFIHSPVDDQKLPIDKFPAAVETVLWDLADPNVFAAVDIKVHRNVVTYLYRPQTMRGPTVSHIGNTKVAQGFTAVLLLNGKLHGQKGSGRLSQVTLASHDAIVSSSGSRKAADKQRHALHQLLALCRLKEAWEMALAVRSKELWQSLARKAMEQLDVEMAIRVYTQIKDAAMVLSLEKLRHTEDKNLLAGYVAMLFQDYDAAQAMFLASSRPRAALEMRRDLLHWSHSLKLASTLAPELLPYICQEYAQELEFKGEYVQALPLYEKGVQPAAPPHDLAAQHNNRLCLAGITRMTFRLGDLRKGRELALRSGDQALIKDCAAIVEGMKQNSEAAELYVHAQCFEKAAGLYIQLKDFANAAPLMARITAPKLHALYAKAKESEGAYAEAAAAYELAKDMDSVVRLCLKYLKHPAKAFDIVRQTRSADGAALVAEYAVNVGDYQAAIEFLLLCKRSADAFQLAKSHNAMAVYASVLAEDGSPEEYLEIASYYEQREEWANAARFYAICGDLRRAIKLYLQGGEPHLKDAIELIKKHRTHPDAELLIRSVHDMLLGETDGKAKDPKYIYMLFVALGDFKQAAPTALLIAAQEQELGNYKVAHATLFESFQDLVANQVEVPEELRRSLLLLHSYVLVKKLVKRELHEPAARMLIRVANSISRFPKHVVPILTSTVIECQRANLKRSSFEFASTLMRQEYRGLIDAKYKRKIEAIVRRAPSEEDEEPLSPCPFCNFDIPNSLLDCPSCKNSVPYCIATGRHMLAADWCFCPSCRFPALYSAFTSHIANEQLCPMCDKKIGSSAIKKLSPQQVRSHLLGTEGAAEDESKQQPEDGENMQAADNFMASSGAPAAAAPKGGRADDAGDLDF